MKSESQPGVSVFSEEHIQAEFRHFLEMSKLDKLAPLAVWSVQGSNAAINYSTHGIFRYFGKFPAPIAGHLIEKYSKYDQLVFDPACGSGTTGVEALLRGRKARVADINPLATLLARVKTQHIPNQKLLNAIEHVLVQTSRSKRLHTNIETLEEINLNHWFLPETINGLTRLSWAISTLEDELVREFMQVTFASIIRRVSRATTQQGRMFLDIATAIEDVKPIFEKAAIRNALRVAALPESGQVAVETRNILEETSTPVSDASLIIFHPPYFNAYKYSSINSLEMAWLGISRKQLRRGEIREFFKVGKPENASSYIEDMVRSLQVIRSQVKRGCTLGLMIGDTRIHGEYIPVTSEILKRVSDVFEPVEVALRVPRYTEASWAASQRRQGVDLGITMYDFVISLRAC